MSNAGNNISLSISKDKSNDYAKLKSQKSQFSSSFVEDFSCFVDRNLKEIRYISYGLAVVGVLLVGRSIHISKKFNSLSDIPARYIQTHIKLQGKVKAVSSKGVLSLQHIPIISGVWQTKQPDSHYLPVHVGGVEITESSCTWLQRHLVDKAVTFQLLKINSEKQLDCIIYTHKYFFRKVCVNELLIKEGLGLVRHIEGLPQDNLYIWLSGKLVKAEIQAEKKRKGLWTRPSLWQRVKSSPKLLLETGINKLKSIFRKSD